MSGTIKMRARLKEGEVTVKALIKHPMETGRRKDPETDEVVPAHFIQEVFAEYQGKQVFHGYLGTGVSANPFISFAFTGGEKGAVVKLVWVDNKGQSDSAEVPIK